MEAHTQMLNTLHKRIEDFQHLQLQISGGEILTSSYLPKFLEEVYAQIVAAKLSISKFKKLRQCFSDQKNAQQGDWVSNREHLRQQNEQLELLQKELLILQTDYPKTRVNIRQVQTIVSDLRKLTTHLDQLNQTYRRGLQEVGDDLDSLATSIDTQLQTKSREEERVRLELKLSVVGHISTVVSGFGQLSIVVAEEVPRLIQSRDSRILEVQEACRALHANQQVLNGIL